MQANISTWQVLGLFWFYPGEIAAYIRTEYCMNSQRAWTS